MPGKHQKIPEKNQGETPGNLEEKRWWPTFIVAAIAAAAAVATVVVAVIALPGSGSKLSSGTLEPGSVSSFGPSLARTASPSATASQSPAPTASGQAQPSGSEAFNNVVAFGGNGGLDLDVNPPTNDDFNTIHFNSAPPQIQAATGADYVAAWSGPGVPTQAECQLLVATHPLEDVPAQVGVQVCIHSQGLHTAYFKVGNIDIATGVISGTLIIWSS